MFFKTIGKMKSDNRGFTITELMVTVVIMALVAATIALVAGNIWKRYRLVENRYIVQTEVKAIMDAFSADTSTGSLATATNVSLLYEDPEYMKTNHKLLSCPELNTFSENEDHSLTFTRDLSDAAAKYSYLFVYDDHFYVLNGNSNTANRFSYTDEVLVNIKYSVSIDAFRKDDTGKESTSRLNGTTAHTFLTDGVTIKVECGPGYDFYYYLNCSFALKNAGSGDIVNYNGSTLTSTHCAGYNCYQCNNTDCERYHIQATDYHKNDEGKYTCAVCNEELSNVGSSTGNYPSSANSTTYADLQKEATVIKYISLSNFNSGDAGVNSGSTNVPFNCAFSVLMMNSGIGEGVLNTLRDFRDNTLRGTAIGDLIIEKYYAWSPQIISFLSHHDIIRSVAATVVKDTAYLIELTK